MWKNFHSYIGTGPNSPPSLGHGFIINRLLALMVVFNMEMANVVLWDSNISTPTPIWISNVNLGAHRLVDCFKMS